MVDTEVGTVFQAWENSRYADNTIFIFTADHGEMLMEHNETKKGGAMEAACRVPLLVIGPDIRAGICDTTQISGTTDVTATILDYASIEPMPEMHGTTSLRPALEADQERLKDYVVSESYYLPLSACKRTVYFDDLKVICDRHDHKFKVYNFMDDKYELNNLAESVAGQAAILKAESHLREWAKMHQPCDRILKAPRMLEGGSKMSV